MKFRLYTRKIVDTIEWDLYTLTTVVDHAGATHEPKLRKIVDGQIPLGDHLEVDARSLAKRDAENAAKRWMQEKETPWDKEEFEL